MNPRLYVLLSWSFLLLSWIAPTNAQITLIPDANFEARLIQLHIDSDTTINGQVLTSDVAGVIYINVSGNNISDLTGIRDFTALRQLDCYNNSLTNLDVSGMPALRSVSASNNLLTQLQVSNCLNLLNISCDINIGLITVDVSNTPSLRAFHGQQTGITTMDFSNNLQIIHVVLSKTPLSSLNLTNQTTLQILHVDHTPLTTLDVSNCSSLTTLYCNHTNLSTLDVRQNSQLEILYCYNNLFGQLDVTQNLLLTNLIARKNQLTQLDLRNNTLLTVLRVDSNAIATLDVSNSNDLWIFSATNNQLHYVNAKSLGLHQPSANSSVYLTENLPNLTICVNDTALVALGNWWKDSSAVYVENCYNTTLVGHTRQDANNNCLVEATELGLAGNLLRISSATDTTYARSNTNGYYTGELSPGSYQLDIDQQLPYRLPCWPTQNVTVDSLGDLDTIDWSITPTALCPYLEVSMSAPFLRATGGGSFYSVQYCNHGTIAAYGAYVDVTIDSALQVLSSTLPVQSQVGSVYRFNLDTVAINECGSFGIQVLVDSTALVGPLYCSEAHIFPDSLCTNTWNGPIIIVEGSCQSDTVFFEMSNIGSAMVAAQQYSIFEDHVMLSTAPFTLGANGSIRVAQAAAPGKLYRLEAVQAANIPPYVAPPVAHHVVPSCQPNFNGTWNRVSVGQFYNGNTTPWVHVDCQPAIGAYDPNDKTPQPIGYGADHYITKNTPLHYRVRFQNTGNDTAFNVVVVDTLSTHLDPLTLTIKGNSHPYTWTISGEGILRMNFGNIKLVDSLTNEPLSHGYFTYDIQQKANLPLGTVIENTAAIYFDYNAPIFTNTTWHTLGENFVTVVNVDEVWIEQTQIQVYPNPFKEQTTIAVTGQDFETLTLEVVDVAGRRVEQIKVKNTHQITFQRKQLLPGLYFYRLSSGRQAIGVGKLQVR